MYIKGRNMNSVVYILLVHDGDFLCQKELLDEFPREALALSHK